MENVIYNIDLGNKDSRKIAGFDLDSTLIKTKSGRLHPKDCEDWQYYDDTLKDILMKLQYKDGYNIVIFTNQAGLEGKEQKQADFIFKLNNIIASLDINVSYFVSTGYGEYRKPMVGFLSILETEIGPIEKSESFYCGDACGRPAGWKWSSDNSTECVKHKKDFSISDLLFAHNCRLKFYTPEEFYHPKGFKSDPVNLPERPYLNYTEPDPFELDLTDYRKYVILMIGLPASGKSHLAKDIQDRYETFDFKIVNRDSLGTKAKNNKLFKQLIDDGDNVIVDNTNLVPKDRQFYLDYVNDDYDVVAVNVTTDPNIRTQLNHVRCYNKGKFIKRIVYNIMKKRMDLSGLADEGYKDIVEYSCKPVFDNEDEKRVFMMYY